MLFIEEHYIINTKNVQGVGSLTSTRDKAIS